VSSRGSPPSSAAAAGEKPAGTHGGKDDDVEAGAGCACLPVTLPESEALPRVRFCAES
jgi:hypothetical protein